MTVEETFAKNFYRKTDKYYFQGKMMHVELLILPYSVVKTVMKEIRVRGSVLTETEFFLLNKTFLRYFLKLELIKVVTQTSRPTLIIVNVQLIIFILTDIDKRSKKTHGGNLNANLPILTVLLNVFARRVTLVMESHVAVRLTNLIAGLRGKSTYFYSNK